MYKNPALRFGPERGVVIFSFQGAADSSRA